MEVYHEDGDWETNKWKDIDWPPNVIKIPELDELRQQVDARIPGIWDGPVDPRVGDTLVKDTPLYKNRRKWKLYVSCMILGSPKDYPKDLTPGAFYKRYPDGQIFYLDDVTMTNMMGFIHRNPGICPEDLVIGKVGDYIIEHWQEDTGSPVDFWTEINNDERQYGLFIQTLYWMLAYLIYLGLIRVNDSRYTPRDKYFP